MNEQITVNLYSPNQVKTGIAGPHPGVWDDAERRGALTPIKFLADKVIETFLDPKSSLTGTLLAPHSLILLTLLRQANL